MRTWPLVVLLLVFGGTSNAEAPLARRQIRAAEELERDGQVAQARKIYEQIAANEAAAEWADNALLALARLDGSFDQDDALLAKPLAADALASARRRLEAIIKRFPDSDSAPEASWRLALLRLIPSTPHYSPEEAVALLSTLPVLYPEARELPDALVLAARLHLEAGRRQRAQRLAFELLSRFPRHVKAGRAALVLARAAFESGELDEALVELGKAQAAAESDSSARDAALDLATLLDRLRFSLLRGAKQVFSAPPEALGPPLPAKASDLAFDARGRLYVALERQEAVAIYAPGQMTPERRRVAGLSTLAVDRWQRLWLAGTMGVLAPGGEVFSLPERAEISDIAPVGPATAWVIDRKSRAVILVGEGVTAGGVHAQLPPRAVPRRVVAGAYGGAWILDAKRRSLIQVGADGTSLKVVALEGLAATPVDLARDALGHLYLLDAKAPNLLVFSPDGELLTKQLLPRQGEAAFGRAELLAVDRSGALVVFEGRKKRLLWLR